jgi:hypothetical protein
MSCSAGRCRGGLALSLRGQDLLMWNRGDMSRDRRPLADLLGSLKYFWAQLVQMPWLTVDSGYRGVSMTPSSRPHHAQILFISFFLHAIACGCLSPKTGAPHASSAAGVFRCPPFAFSVHTHAPGLSDGAAVEIPAQPDGEEEVAPEPVLQGRGHDGVRPGVAVGEQHAPEGREHRG